MLVENCEHSLDTKCEQMGLKMRSLLDTRVEVFRARKGTAFDVRSDQTISPLDTQQFNPLHGERVAKLWSLPCHVESWKVFEMQLRLTLSTLHY